MRKFFLTMQALLPACLITFSAASQENYWGSVTDSSNLQRIKTAKGKAFEKQPVLYSLDAVQFCRQLTSVARGQEGLQTARIILPNAKGGMEKFEVVEASNFDPALQARFPEIRSFSGKSLDDPGTISKINISPRGVQTFIIRVNGGKEEIIEPLMTGQNLYMVYSRGDAGRDQAWTCGSTSGSSLNPELNTNINGVQRTVRSTGKLRTLRIALTCSGEYANKLGAYNGTPADVGVVLAAFNTVLSYSNMILERDLALHLYLVNSSQNALYFDPATDPFTPENYFGLLDQAQLVLDSGTGSANYDLGMVFSSAPIYRGQVHAIGSVCMDGVKGKSLAIGRESHPADGPEFSSIVIHEIGHLLGGGHTFTHVNQQPSTQQSVEVGSGVTLMSYGGLFNEYNVIAERIPFFHERSIRQIESYLEYKPCIITEDIRANNPAPEVNTIPDYTIPKSTPYFIGCTATDADISGLTFSLEEDDDAGPSDYGPKSTAYPQKKTGPVFTTLLPSSSVNGTVNFIIPGLPAVLNGQTITGTVSGTSPGMYARSLSSVGRIIKHVVTVRDNVPYSQAAPRTIGQTARTATTITVDGNSGPFAITTQNDPVSYLAGSTQTINWSVNGTDLAPINCQQVLVSYSPDGGYTYPPSSSFIVSNTGSAQITFPSQPTSNGRISVVAMGNIFFDINNSDIGLLPPQSFNFGNTSIASLSCHTGPAIEARLPVTANGGFDRPVQLSAAEGVPAGCTIEFPVNPVLPGTAAAVILRNANTLRAGMYRVIIEGRTQDPVIVVRHAMYFEITENSAPVISSHPQPVTVCPGNPVMFTVAANSNSLEYQWQMKAPEESGFTDMSQELYPNSGVLSAVLNLAASELNAGMNGYQYRCRVTAACGSAYSRPATLTIPGGIIGHPASNNYVCAGGTVVLSVQAGPGQTAPVYQWEVKAAGASVFTPLNNTVYPSAATSSLVLPNVTDAGYHTNSYRCRVSFPNSCSEYSSESVLFILPSALITRQPESKTVCEGQGVSFIAEASGTGLVFQWQRSTPQSPAWENYLNSISEVNSCPLNLQVSSVSANGYKFRCAISKAGCGTVYSAEAVLTVNNRPSVISNPQSKAVCTGSNAVFTVTASGSNLTYQWYEYRAPAPPRLITGATSATLTISAVSIAQNGKKYYCEISNAGCIRVHSSIATLTVNAVPSIVSHPQNQSVCINSTAHFVVTASVTDVAYQWWCKLPGGNWEKMPFKTASTLSVLRVISSMHGTRYKCIVRNSCAELESQEALLDIPDRITGDPVSRTACAGQAVMFTVQTTTQQAGINSSYQWEVKPPAATGFTVINAALNTTASTPSLVLSGITPGMNGNQYRCRVSNMGSCTEMTGEATLTVTGGTTVIAASGIRWPESRTLCAGNPVSFSVSAVPSALAAYKWQVKPRNGNGFYNIEGNNSATLTIPAVNTSMNGNQYRCILTYGCGDIISPPATLTVPGIEIQPQPQTVCQYSEARFNVSATGGFITGYTWKVKTPASAGYQYLTGNSTSTNAELVIPGYALTSALNGNLYRCEVTYYTPCGGTTYYSDPALLTVKDKIISDPASQTVCAGLTATFSLGVTGNVRSYQWQVQGNGSIWGFGDIAGATGSELRVSSVTSSMSGNKYRCKYINECGNTVTSSPATLYVPPGIVSQPLSQTVCPGSAAAFSVGLMEGMPGIRYSWMVKKTATGNFEYIPGANNASLNIPAVTAAMDGYVYRCKINYANCGYSLSNEAILTVLAPGTILSNPVSKTVCTRETVEFAVEYCKSPNAVPAYQWYIEKFNGLFPVTGNPTAITPRLVLSNISMSMNGNKYYCRIDDAGVIVRSSTATLTVTGITDPAGNGNYHKFACLGSEGRFSVQANGPITGYRWQFRSNSNAPFADIMNNASAATSQLRIPNVSSAHYGAYRCRVIRVGCVEDISATIQLNRLTYSCRNAVSKANRSPVNPGDSTGAAITMTEALSSNSNDIRNGAGIISLYPVPNSGSFNVRINTDQYPSIDLNIYDQSGRLLVSRQVRGLVAGSVIPVTVPHAVNGLYQLRISSPAQPEKGAVVKTFLITGGQVATK